MRLIVVSFALLFSFGIHAQVPDSIHGNWKCSEIRCRIVCEYCCIYPHYDLSITDSLYYFHYPFQYIGASAFQPEFWSFSNNTLIYTLKEDVQFIYKRSDNPFSDVVIDALKRDTINLLSLANRTWKLKTWKEDDIGEEGFDHTIHYPFRLPSKFYYSVDELKTLLKGSQLQLLIDGKKRWCTIVELTSSRLTFRTGKWSKEPVEFTYELAY